jgi:carboxyl-terminal processing protease
VKRAILLLIAIGFVSSASAFWEPQVPPRPDATVEQVWKSIDEIFFDPTYHHHDIQELRRQYVGPKYKTDGEAHAVIRAMLQSLGEPQTRLLEPPELASTFGEFNGTSGSIGLADPWIRQDNKTRLWKVLHVIAGSPAFGTVLPGDEVETIDGNSAKDLRRDDFLVRMRGEPGSKLELQVLRRGRSVSVDTTRAVNTLKTVQSHVISENGATLGYVTLSQFGKDSADEMRQALTEFDSKHVQGFILDLRNNPGGFVPASREIACFFLGDQKTIYRTLDHSGVPRKFSTEGGAR